MESFKFYIHIFLSSSSKFSRWKFQVKSPYDSGDNNKIQNKPFRNTSENNFLIDRIEHEYLFYCSNLVVNSYFLISNPRKYHLWFNRDHAI